MMFLCSEGTRLQVNKLYLLFSIPYLNIDVVKYLANWYNTFTVWPISHISCFSCCFGWRYHFFAMRLFLFIMIQSPLSELKSEPLSLLGQHFAICSTSPALARSTFTWWLAFSACFSPFTATIPSSRYSNARRQALALPIFNQGSQQFGESITNCRRAKRQNCKCIKLGNSLLCQTKAQIFPIRFININMMVTQFNPFTAEFSDALRNASEKPFYQITHMIYFLETMHKIVPYGLVKPKTFLD